MDKKIIRIMMVLLIMFLAVCASPKQVMAADGTLKVQTCNTGTSSATNSISPNFKVVNTGTAEINLSEVKLRYYYTKDGSQEQSFWCNGAFISGAQDCTSKVIGRFVDMNTPASNAEGDSGNSNEVSATPQVAATTTVLSCSPNPSTYGQSATFTATVPGGATGIVTFKDGSTTLGAGTVNL